MKNKIEDLRNHLFAQLERLGDENLKKGDLDFEIRRAKSINEVASVIVESAKVECQLIIETNFKGTGFIQPPDLNTPGPGGQKNIGSNLDLDGNGNVIQKKQDHA